MKRILTLFVALCLSVSCLVIPAYGAEAADGGQAQPKIELGIRLSEIDMLLKALGILDSSFDLTETSNVTLAEFAEGTARLMKLSYNADIAAFSDSTGFAGINCIAAAGYIKAEPNAACMPTAAITTLDAVKILLRALGCGNLVDYYENDSATLLAFAKKIELVESVDVAAKLSRVNMAELLYNALIASFDSTTMDVGDVTINFAYTSLLTGMYNIHGIRGMVTANEYISLYRDMDKTYEGQLRINEKAYDMAIPVSDDYLGRYVTAYVRTAQGVETVVSIVSDLGFDKCVEIKGENIGKAEKGSIYYYPTAESKKTTVVKYENPILVYNGVTYNDSENVLGASEICELIEKAASTKRGTVKVITDGVNDILIVDLVDNATIHSIDKENQVVYVKFVGKDEATAVSLKKTNEALRGWTKPVAYVRATEADGVTPVSLDDLKIGELVSLIISEDGSAIRFIRNKATASGAISAVETKSDDQFVTIDGTRYEVDRDYRKTVDLKPGDDSVFLTDIFGRIAGASKAIVNGTPKPGVLLATSAQGTFTRTVYVKLYKDDGKFGILTLDNKVEFDGDRIENDDAYTRLSNLLADGTADQKRFVFYKTDKDGNITYIDTIDLGENEEAGETLKMVGAGEASREIRRADGGHLGNGWMSFAKASGDYEEGVSAQYYPAYDSTQIFSLPREEDGKIGDEDSFVWGVEKATSISQSKTYKNCVLYKLGDATPFVEYAVNYKVSDPMPNFNAFSGLYLVNDIFLGLGNDGDTVAVMETAKTVSMTTHEMKIANQVYLLANGCKMLINGLEIGNYISAGDAVLVAAANPAGEYTAVQLLYDYSEDLVAWGWKNISASSNTVKFDGWKEDINTLEDYNAWVNNRTEGEYEYRANSVTRDTFVTSGGRRYILCDVADLWDNGTLGVITCKDDATDFSEVFVKVDAQVYEPFFDENRPWDDKAYHGAHYDILSASVCGEGEKPDKILVMHGNSTTTGFIVWKQY